MKTSPHAGCIAFAMSRSSTDLPPACGPTTAYILPCFSCRLTSRSGAASAVDAALADESSAPPPDATDSKRFASSR